MQHKTRPKDLYMKTVQGPSGQQEREENSLSTSHSHRCVPKHCAILLANAIRQDQEDQWTFSRIPYLQVLPLFLK